jgi:hypothetical protein
MDLAKNDLVHEEDDHDHDHDHDHDAGQSINKDRLVVDNTNTNIIFPESPESSYISSKMAMAM